MSDARKIAAPAEGLAKGPAAAGVAYFERDGAPGLKFFQCDRLNCTLSTKGCADRWRKAEGDEPAPQMRHAINKSAATRAGTVLARSRSEARRSAEGTAHADRVHGAQAAADGILTCRGCPIGAAHANRTHVEYSQYFGATICPRCRRGTTRMIQGRVCVSCRNREYEVERGANARGNVPVELLENRPHTVELRIEEGGRARHVRAHNVTDLFETVFQTLRTTRGVLAFGFQGPTGLLRQGRLF